MPTLHVLVIDDEPAAREVLAAAVSKAGYSVDTAADIAEATAKLVRGNVDVALCDIQLPDGHGIDLLKRSRALDSDTAFIMVTAFASVETAVEALRAGAFDYIIKPVRHVEVLHRLSQLEALRGLREENRLLRKVVRANKPLYPFTSTGMRKVQRLVDRVAPSDNTVLITGESGTGKGVVARMIHERSGRRERPFIPVNCGAIPDQLLESEFFGHTKGAFTGADHAEKGLFLAADRGTLFLDEIGELPLLMQTKLLHVIEDKEVRPLGSGQARHVDTRIVAATNCNLSQLISQGRFREDLYFRLKIFEILIPPLRERPEDIRGLIEFILRANEGRRGTSQALELEPEAEEILLGYDWPGNVRELENVITRASILAEGNCISVDELPSELTKAVSLPNTAKIASAANGSLRIQRQMFEAEVVRRAINDAGGDRKLAAQRLKISLSSLYSKFSELESEHELPSDTGSEVPNLRHAKS
ncbi:MAG: sigma-54-dependent Fis family transcriptional regulator [Betaproteobacteria bacterium]|nr:sigma-54-dependent Fis family transcriptional regulator [Betaproteobacteria bacterium]